MIRRYTRKEMARIWLDENRLNRWLDIELLACEAMEDLGRVPKGTAERIRKKVGRLTADDAARIDEIERTTRHDVIAFLTLIEERAGDDSKYVHLGLTSYDVVDTAFSLQLVEAADLLTEDLRAFAGVLERRALEFKTVPQIGRSHGIHAEPITFGVKLLLFWDETMRNIARLQMARESVAVGKLSGAVGTFANVEPSVEEYVCAKLGLKAAHASSQVISRDNHAEFFTTLAIVATSLEKFAVEVRHLQRTEVREAEEFFVAGQKGSSAMPHKRNPILTENVTGLARLIRSYAFAALENVPLWHERDISHSSVERVIAPDATIALDFAIVRLSGVFENLMVHPKAMEENLALAGGLIFSEAVLLALCGKGLLRQKAYGIVQRSAMKAWNRGGDFKDLLSRDPEVTALLSQTEIDSCFDLRHHLRNVDYIFEMTFKRWKG
ncbi:MAG: adenylosuccinate lyase [Deltaproteobacteria bacterium]|nr:adenylosuccinate lyase [Deltaproteobacteria bacterium]